MRFCPVPVSQRPSNVARKGERFNGELTDHRINWDFFGRIGATQTRGLPSPSPIKTRVRVFILAKRAPAGSPKVLDRLIRLGIRPVPNNPRIKTSVQQTSVGPKEYS